MFTPKIRPLLTRVYYGALGGGLLSSSILFSNANSTTTTTTTTLTEKRIMAHCQDDSNQRRNNSSCCSSSGGENADHAVPILTKKTNRGHATVNDEDDEDELTRQGFDRSDFDIYLTRPTKEDLLPLLTEYTINNKNVWPWIWTWHNINGPHYVFVGTNPAINKRIEELASSSPRNNIIVITNSNNDDDDNSSSSTGGNKHALTKDASYYYTNRCGIIENVTIREIDVTNKIILLSDERILCFTELYIV